MTEFDKLLVAEQRSMMRHAMKLTRHNFTAAEDLVSETNVKALKARDSFTPGTFFKAWVHTLMRHHYYSVVRNAWRQQELHPDYDAPVQPPPDLADIVAALATMRPDARNTLLMRVAGFSEEEVIARINVKRGTVRSRVNRARQSLNADRVDRSKRPPPGTALNALEMLVFDACTSHFP
jgi:RNA polymerase sigma-70 factor (ECF subfamily)